MLAFFLHISIVYCDEGEGIEYSKTSLIWNNWGFRLSELIQVRIKQNNQKL